MAQPRSRRWTCVIGLMAVTALVAGACSTAETVSDPTSTPTTSLVSSTSTSAPSTSTSGPDLPTSTPEEQGIDSASLTAFVEQVVANGGIDSVTVVRNGHMVLDATVYPFPPGTPHSVHSVTKSVVGTLIGIAIDQGLLAGVDVPVVELLPEATPASTEPWKASMTVDDLLTMRSGLDCRDSFLYDWEGLYEWRSTDQWVKSIFACPMASEPGTEFEYSNGASHLLSAVITAVTGSTAASYADEVLFGPLGITDYVWPTSPEGVSVGYDGIEMLPADMAKIGQLYLDGGRWNGERVLSAEWVDTATADHVGPLPRYAASGYGYQWWVTNEEWIAARGYAGQYIYLSPRLDLVVAFTAGLPPHRIDRPLALLTDYLLPATKPEPLHPNPVGTTELGEAVAAARAGPEANPTAIPATAAIVDGVRYEFEPNDPLMEWFELTFHGDTARFTLAQDFTGQAWFFEQLGYADLDEPLVADVGLDGRFIANETWGVTTAWRGEWTDDATFVVESQNIGLLTGERLVHRFVFEGDTARLEIRNLTTGEGGEATASVTE